MKPMKFSPFRDNILKAMSRTKNDEELRKELHEIVCKEVDKEIPYIMRPVKVVVKTVTN